MKMLVEKLVDGKQDFEVVDADCASQAINQCSLNFLIRERDNVDQKNEEVAYVAVYEIGQTNLLEHTDDIFRIHRFYREKLEELGIDSTTFEKL
ncbi:type III secretion system protein PrgG [Enterococcus casseliflavus]|uniref:type III secretion system protein PrgG n=1 Tax=Enterococcus TaxID=1350 RepID=UPI00288DADA5|nr:type III secretion system protein PrgG [Enterococcus gallinarum]MDT2697958.1 type III secretion system protein PrgG [Enterococcus gallinarum]